MMDKKDIISKLAGYKLEGDIEGRENFSLHTCSYLDNSIIHLSIRDNYGIKF